MKLAIIGATSQIARDLIIRLLTVQCHSLELYSRKPEILKEWLIHKGYSERYTSNHIDTIFIDPQYDAVLNFIGAGDPAKVRDLGSSIFKLTQYFDSKIIDYLYSNPSCKYIFLSSGAVYGDIFSHAQESHTYSKFNINNLNDSDWYGLAKFQAEVTHRSLEKLNIVDVRVFGYFSENQDLESKFILSEMYRAIRDDVVFITGRNEMVRDYIHPDDFYQLVNRVLMSGLGNYAVDCYSREIISKEKMICAMYHNFNMKFRYIDETTDFRVNKKNERTFYYSKNVKIGKDINYNPIYSSEDSIVEQMHKIVGSIK